MWSSRSYLQKCTELKQAGFNPPLEKGARIGRGFADLGSEEFLMLSDSQMLSLFTGQKSDLNEEHRHFFFAIPRTSEIVNWIQKCGWNIQQMIFVDQRSWRVVMEKKAGEPRSFEGREMDEALIEALIFVWRDRDAESSKRP